MKVLRKIIQIDEERCDGCGQCVPDCAEGALEMRNGKARMISEKYCDGLGACLGSCPNGALQIIEREADDFDEVAVEELLKQQKDQERQSENTSATGGCPSARLISLQPATSCQAANKPVMRQVSGPTDSALSHWPVQIRLVPPSAPFLKNGDLLVAADCTPVAYPDFHRDFLAGRVVMMGCPKFDDSKGYIEKFREVFKTAKPKSVTVCIMEVPCCSAMKMIVEEASRQAAYQVPVEQVTIGVQGQILARENWRNAD
jgi:Fe-S-cluster-containing hydrogenase component 2